MASSLAEGLRMWERTKPAQAEGLRMRLLKTLRVFSTLHTPSAATSFDPLPAERRTYAALACIDLGGCHRFASRRLAGARAIEPAQAEGLRMRERETLRKPKAYGCGCLRRCASFHPTEMGGTFLPHPIA